MPLDLRPHKYHIDKASGTAVMERVNPYIRLKIKTWIAGEGPEQPGHWLDEAPLFIQGGKIYGETGPAIPIKDVPEWFWKEAKKIAPVRLKEFGIEIPENPSNAQNLRTSKKYRKEETAEG